MTHLAPDRETPAIDRDVRAALEPTAAEVERAVAHALAGRQPAAPRFGLLLAATAATLLVALLVAFAVTPRDGGRAEPPPLTASIVSVGPLVLLEAPGRGILLTDGNRAASPSRPSPSLLVVWKEPSP